jgi:mono/diheme cytochrome c family protein
VLNSKGLLEAVDDEALHDAVRDGIPNTSMPAYGEEHGGPLNGHQIDALVAFMRNWESTAPVLTPVPQDGRGERIARGVDLYSGTCAVCHGENGQGGVGRDLNSEEYLTSFDDAYLTEAIARGRPRQGMPTWGKVLSPSQIQDLVTFMRDWEGGSSLYAKYCGFCHGVLGQGSPNPSNPGEMIPALNSAQYLDAHDDGQIRQAIVEGVDEKGMPPSPLSDIEVDKIVDFLREWDQALAGFGGEELFTTYCAACHGWSGEGGANPFNPRENVTALNSPDYLGGHDDAYIHRGIAEGIPGTGMVALSQLQGGPLTDEEIDRLVAFMRGWETGVQALPQATPTAVAGQPEAPVPTTAVATAQGDAARGDELYAANCAACHGAEGQGTAVAKEPLNTADYLDNNSDEAIYEAISDGVGAAMPGYGGTLTAEEITDMVALFRNW